ncbi:hypothetical protein ACB098_10G025500 [Castanea mollissima]
MKLADLTPPQLLRPESDSWKLRFPNTSLSPSWTSKFSLPHPLPPVPILSSFDLDIVVTTLSTRKPLLPLLSDLMEISTRGKPIPSTLGLIVEVTPSFCFRVLEVRCVAMLASLPVRTIPRSWWDLLLFVPACSEIPPLFSLSKNCPFLLAPVFRPCHLTSHRA